MRASYGQVAQESSNLESVRPRADHLPRLLERIQELGLDIVEITDRDWRHQRERAAAREERPGDHPATTPGDRGQRKGAVPLPRAEGDNGLRGRRLRQQPGGARDRRSSTTEFSSLRHCSVAGIDQRCPSRSHQVEGLRKHLVAPQLSEEGLRPDAPRHGAGAPLRSSGWVPAERRLCPTRPLGES